MTPVAKSKTKQRRAGADEPPRIFHIYNRHAPQTALCGDAFKNGKDRLGSSKTHLPRSGYEFCPLCVLEMQISQGWNDAQISDYMEWLERNALAKRYEELKQ